MSQPVDGHGGDIAVAVAQAHGTTAMFTLSGAHVFPMYDGAVHAVPPVRIVDVRHEQTAVFAAEAIGKLTRTPGLAVLTAGPGVTNGVSPIAQAYFSGSPLVAIGGRAPSFRWGTGSLQELDQPPILATVTKLARTVGSVDEIADDVDEAFRVAGSAHRGPAFLDVPMDHLFARSTLVVPDVATPSRVEPDPDALATIAGLLADARRPVLVVGTDVWQDGAEDAALRLVDDLQIPVVTNGLGRGVVPARHPCLATKARSTAFGRCDLALVVGTALDFRLGYGVFGGADDGSPPATVVHLADSPGQVSDHAKPSARAAGDLTLVLDGLREEFRRVARPTDWSGWRATLADVSADARVRERTQLESAATPIHPARIYGELLPRLDDDAVLIGDGGDFVSFAGKFIEPARPGCWLDPGPYGCLGSGLGASIAARIARPDAQVVALLGDGAAGMSIMDVDTLVRHGLPVVMVVGNNSCWGLEKGPMQLLYGYDVATDLAPGTAYDRVVAALGGAGERVDDPAGIGPALDRAFAAGVPYLVNVITDPEVAYPRRTTGI